MEKTRSLKAIIKIVFSYILVISGTWALTEAVYGPYLVYLNNRSAKKQGLPYSSKEIFTELLIYLVLLVFGFIFTWIGKKLWGKWKIISAFTLIGLGLIHLIPDNPMGVAIDLTGIELFTCQVDCRWFGLLYFLVGTGFLLWYLTHSKNVK